MGQPFNFCDRCGQPAWEHEGLERVQGSGPFDTTLEIVPWARGELERIRAKWDPDYADPHQPTS
jgi:hypothetical protein